MKQWINIALISLGLCLTPTAAHANGHTHEHMAKHTTEQTNHATHQEHQGAYFISPQADATVGTTIKVVMGIHGMKVHKAGDLIEGTGHHHLIIDGVFMPKGEVVSKDAQHIHFGGGQTETSITLTPGKHTLTLQFADGYHQSYGKEASQTIQVTVVNKAL